MKRTPKTASRAIEKNFEVKPIYYGWTTESKKEIVVIATNSNGTMENFYGKWNGGIFTVTARATQRIDVIEKCKIHIEMYDEDSIEDGEEDEGE